MEKAGLIKIGFVVALTVLSIGAIIPTLAAPGTCSVESDCGSGLRCLIPAGESQGVCEMPDWLKSYEKVWDRKLSLGLDLQGGLLLQYRVEVDKAVRDKADRLADDMLARLEAKDPSAKVTVEVDAPDEGSDEIRIIVTFEDPTKLALIDDDFRGFFQNMLPEQGAGSGRASFLMDPAYIEQTEEYAISQAIDTIRDRIDALGVTEPDIKKSGKSDIVIQLPGLREEEFARTKRLIGTTAQLQFKRVDDVGANSYFQGLKNLPEGITAFNDGGESTVRAKTKKTLKDWFKADPERVPKKKQVVYEEITRYLHKAKPEVDPENSYWRAHLVFSKTELTGEFLQDATVSTNPQTNRPEVSLTFDSRGAEVFGKLTTENVGKRFAILLDDTLKSNPVINEPIPGGRARITLGGYKGIQELFADATDLVTVLRNGALPAPIEKKFETSVGASLGEDSIRRGKVALSVAGAFVVLFMLIYYRGGGVIANIALGLNVLFIMAALTTLNATLTLPGIAGIILTIGMAVDANVIIFERIREEIRLGKGPKAAVEAGYAKALSAVLDANITTAIAALVLMEKGGAGPIRGFAVTLLIGIIVSVFTAVIVTRICYDFINERFRPERLSI
jgi:preprotein translocase subunit SecD